MGLKLNVGMCAVALLAATVGSAWPASALAAAPVVSAVSPAEGSSAGGTKVTIEGEGLKGVTAVHFGASEVALPKPVPSQTKLKVVSPPGTVGTVDVTVSSPEGGTSAITPSDQYTYTSSPPVVLKISPNHGNGAGGPAFTINGERFTGATEVSFGGHSTAFTLKNSKTIKGKVPPALTIGAVPVTVTTPEGTSAVTPASEYTYAAEFPEIESLSPFFGPAVGGNEVSVEGKGFLGASEVVFDHVPALSFEVVSDAQIRAVAPPYTVSKVPIQVTTPEGTSLYRCASNACKPVPRYEYIHPTVTSVEPAGGPVAGGTPITVTGSGFGKGKEETAILIGRSFAASVHCSSSSVCTAVTTASSKAGPQPLTVRIKSNKPERTAESEATFLYE